MHVTIIYPHDTPNLSSIMGSLEILTEANEYWKKSGNKSKFEICIAGFNHNPDASLGFFSVKPVNIDTIKYTDLIIIPSLSHNFADIIRDNATLIDWIRLQYKEGAEIASICTGAFLLAATGLLDGRVCSTHWRAENEFRRMFPHIELQTDKLITSQQGIFTNGGAFSFLNMLLFLVERYFDRQTAIFCSKIFQIEMDRTSQSPFFIFDVQKNHGDDMVSKAQLYLEKNLDQKVSFEDLANHLAVSRRNFDRRFIKATGNTPVEYFQRLKIEVAKRTLEKGRKSIYEVMDDVGYTDERTFRDVFRKIAGLSPNEYRARYKEQPKV